MFKLKNGVLRTTIFNKNDLNLYIQAGWSLVEDEVKEEPKKESSLEKSEKVNEPSNPKRKSVKK